MNKNICSFFLVLSMTGLVSCAKKNTSSALPSITAPRPSPVSKPVEEQVELDRGTYRASLVSVNGALAPDARGEFIIKIKDDLFTAEAQVDGVQSGIKHFQEIMAGAECPDENADSNFDGVIDSAEAVGVAGKTLLPLDSHLNTQVEGLLYGPIANEDGHYFYRRSSPMGPMMEDLLAYDDEPDDYLVKLSADSKLALSKKVIIVYGISSDVELPETVKGRGDLTPHESLPVLCGKLKRLDP